MMRAVQSGPVEAPRKTEDPRTRFEDLIVPQMAFLARVCRSMSRNDADADDLAQETLINAFRAMDSFDGTRPRAWLGRIARNNAINIQRRRREFAVGEQGTVEPEPDELGSPEEIFLSGLVDQDLRKAFDALPPSFRVVVQLVDVEDMTYREAAEALDLPLGTVMSRLHRARTRLREALQDKPIGKAHA